MKVALRGGDTQTNSYDEDGYQTGYSYVYDYDGDGVANYRSEVTYTLDDDGNTTVEYQDIYSDGATLSSARRYVMHTPELGFKGEYSFYRDDDVDGIEDYSFYVKYSYDENGNVIGYIKQYDTDNDGVVDSDNSYTYSYNELSRGVGAALIGYFVDNY